MPKPRKEQVCLEATPYYHCVSRCVRKAYLCGVDINTNESYEHRRNWLENELIKQAQVFAIDIAAYAIMSNHYHVVLHINKSEADNWSFDEVLIVGINFIKVTHLANVSDQVLHYQKLKLINFMNTPNYGVNV